MIYGYIWVSTRDQNEDRQLIALPEFNIPKRHLFMDKQASIKAHVHCVIMGFGCASNSAPKKIYTTERYQEAENINRDLLDDPTVLVDSRKIPLCPVAEVLTGNRPADGGVLLIGNSEIDDFIGNTPEVKKYIRPFMQATDFINNKKK